MVPSGSGIFSEYREVTGTPGNLMGLSGPRWKRGEEARARPHAPPPSPNRTRRGGGAPLPSSPPLLPPPKS